MQLKRGVKQTEVGVIPEDWVVKPLGLVATYMGGRTSNPSATLENTS